MDKKIGIAVGLMLAATAITATYLATNNQKATDAASLKAQRGNRPGPGGQANAMFADLGLQPDQQSKLDQIQKELRSSMRDRLRPGTGKEAPPDFAQMQQQMQAADEKIRSILTPQQLAKFDKKRQEMMANGPMEAGPMGQRPQGGFSQ
jgi:Spy/CpxP family protein refolding chaperone